MGKNWWKRRVRPTNQIWDPKVAKSPRAPSRPADDMVTEYVTVLLKRLGACAGGEESVQITVPGTMTFDVFTTKARERLSIAAHRPIQWFVGPRSITPDGGALMSSFPKQDYLNVSYV